ncbi:MAG: hypothetical protein A2698_01525 [Candidatus Levybacteria bacterium RIFCSPHIGHO2_01_FULL_42_15]|nr:MAG: hypothetical protein A2698_01525 [Candidatus Levybacteria bacterium RIFCSPHIGHO2_01_FULL_42_15]
MGKFLTQKEEIHKLAELEQHLYVFSHTELKRFLQSIGFDVYKTPRSSILFGGPFLDNHAFLLSAIIFVDSLLDIFPLPQIGWDTIIFAQKSAS